MATTIRSSSQLYIDAHLDHNAKKVLNIADGTLNNDGASVGQMNTAIGNAVSGLGNSIHVPVADLTAAKAVASAGRADKMLMLIETLGLYRFDAELIIASNDDTIIRPTDVATDSVAGRWIKVSSTITDHNNLSSKQGGTTAEYYHLTAAQHGALHTQETASSIGVIVNGAAVATPNDTDLVATVESSVVKKITWTNVKVFLKTYFDGIYWLKTATGAVTISGTVTSITDKAVTLPKMADVATATFLGRTTAATGVPEAMTVAQARTLLGLTSLNLAQRKYRVTPTGVVNGSNVVYTIADLVLSGTEEVFLNGVLATAAYHYTITYAATTTITIVVDIPTNRLAPSAVGFTDAIVVSYSI